MWRQAICPSAHETGPGLKSWGREWGELGMSDVMSSWLAAGRAVCKTADHEWALSPGCLCPR